MNKHKSGNTTRNHKKLQSFV